MPVSSPSYFPPSRGTDQIVGITAGQGQTGARVFLAGQNAGKGSTVPDIVVIGDNSGGGTTPWTDTNLARSLVIGSNSFEDNYDCTTDKSGTALGSIICYGSNNLTSAVASARLAHTLVIGSSIAAQGTFAAAANYARNMLLGNYIWQNQNFGAGVGSSYNIIIGLLAGAASGAVSTQFLTTVAIGNGAIGGISASNGHHSNGVYIGHNVLQNTTGGTSSNNVVIGALGGGNGIRLLDSVVIGSTTTLGASATGRNVIIGSKATYGTGTDSVVIGYTAGRPTTFAGSFNIIIGSLAGSTLPAGASNRIVLEHNASGLNSALYGDMGPGNMLWGDSTAAQRAIIDTPNGAVNIMQIPQGVKSGTAPNTSGYFYVDSAANNSDNPLHYVNSTGMDSALGPSGPLYVGTGNGLITPAALGAGSTNDWAPAGIGQAQVVNVTPNAAGSTLTGLTAQGNSRVVTLINQGAAANLTLNHNDAGSLAANRFFLPGNVALTIAPNSAVMLWYDPSGPHWHALSWS